jgi:hypothetical protein
LFDNHAAIDLARTVFDFGAPGFDDLAYAARLAVVEAATKQNVPLVIMTYCYAEPGDRPQFERFQSIVEQGGGQTLAVFLSCDRAELLRRAGNPDRLERRKLASPAGLNQYLDRYNFSPVPSPDCLQLDSATQPADGTTTVIIRHFALPTGSQP